MTIDLTTAKPGDRFRARDGEVWTFTEGSQDRRILRDSEGELYDFDTSDGRFWSFTLSCCDLVEALDNAAAPPGPLLEYGSMTIDLEAAGMGDRFASKNNETTWLYLGKLRDDEIPWEQKCRYKMADLKTGEVFGFTRDGRFFGGKSNPSEYDLIRHFPRTPDR